jgi:hypothetical protein
MGSRHAHRGGGSRSAGRPRLVHNPVQLSLAVERADMVALKNIASERGIPLSQLVRETLRAKAQGEP